MRVKYTKNVLNKWLKELSEKSFHGINEKDINGNTVLHLAAQFSNYKIVKLLIEKGANVNIENNKGEVPLHRAALAGKVKSVKAMIEVGAEVDCTNHDGSTPLHLASLIQAKGNSQGTVKELIKAGANINAVNRFGVSPLFYARENTELGKLIKEHGGKKIDKMGIELEKMLGIFKKQNEELEALFNSSMAKIKKLDEKDDDNKTYH